MKFQNSPLYLAVAAAVATLTQVPALHAAQPTLEEVVVTGTRSLKPRTVQDSPVPVDVLSNEELNSMGNTVDIDTGLYDNSIGAEELAVRWQDPDFDAQQQAFYYVRVLQIPTPRHTLYDSIALQQAHPEDKDATIQERAYSSPIWYPP